MQLILAADSLLLSRAYRYSVREDVGNLAHSDAPAVLESPLRSHSRSSVPEACDQTSLKELIVTLLRVTPQGLKPYLAQESF